jgi:hypothetical protein
MEASSVERAGSVDRRECEWEPGSRAKVSALRMLVHGWGAGGARNYGLTVIMIAGEGEW